MNGLLGLLQKAELLVRKNSPTILTAIGASGVATTAYLTGKATWDARGILDRADVEANWPLSNREKFDLVWDLYIPPAFVGAVTIGCVIGATRISSKRVAAAYSLATLSETALVEYRDKVAEKLGDKKEQAIRDEIAQDRVNANPVSQVIVTGSGEVLCYEHHTGRYFNSNMESLRKAQNDVNAKLLSERYVTLDDFYYMVSLPGTTDSGKLGWADKLMSLEFSTVMSSDGKPCLAFEYSYIKPI